MYSYIKNTHAYSYTCISCNTGKSALHDMYAQCPRVSTDIIIRQCTISCVITNM